MKSDDSSGDRLGSVGEPSFEARPEVFVAQRALDLDEDGEKAPDAQPGDTNVAQVPTEPLRLAFDSTFDGVWLVAPDGRTTYASRAMAGFLGSTPNEMRGRPITDFLDETLWPDVEGFLARQQTSAGEAIALRFRRADGTELSGLVTGSPLTTHEGVHVGTMLDISDVAGKRSHDAQVVESQRLDAIGLFAGGIVHDFNNLLTANQGYAELARASLPEGDPIRDDLDQVLASAGRASAITRKLLAFVRRQVPVSVDIDPAQVISDLGPILKVLLGHDVDVVLDVDAEHAWVRVDPTQFEQVIVNLATNARDSMPTGGTVTIAVHDLRSTDPDRPDPELSAGPSVRISVSDTGTGMDEATKARIFDPFYTTKDPGKGTGLGLSTVLGIVAQAGGQIQVETAPEKGSTFHVDLPGVSTGLPDPGICPKQYSADLASLRRSGVVLLAEDDPAVREFSRRSLEAAGYMVLAAAGADQALSASAGWGEAIDVLVTDIVMPGIQGPELAVRIRAQRPGIGVVFISGYADDGGGRGGETRVPGAFLPKPFTVEALSRVVARVVDATRARRDVARG